MTLAWVGFKLMDALQPLMFPYPKGCHIQTPVVRFPLMVYSHRGGGLEQGGLVENTLEAFHNSARLKVHVLELDVQSTLDKQVVVFHDGHLGHMAGPEFQGRAVATLDHKDLPPLRPRHSPAQGGVLTALGPDPVSSTPAGTMGPNPGPSKAGTLDLNPGPSTAVQGDPKDSSSSAAPTGAPGRIPLLSEVFMSFPEFPIQIDIKVDVPGLVEQVHQQVVAQPERRKRLVWGSFRHKVNNEIYERDPHIPLFTSGPRAIYLRLAHAAGRLKQVHIYESVTIVPWRVPAPFRKGNFWFPFLDRSFCDALAERGVSVVYFGSDLNDTDAYRACIEAGGSAVCTDRPSLLQAFLAGGSSGPKETDNGYNAGDACSSSSPATRPLRVDADKLCQHTGSKAGLACPVCSEATT